MITGLLMIQMEHRSYVSALREFQSRSSAKARELLRTNYMVDNGRLAVVVENDSPLTTYVRYVVINRGGGDPLIFEVNRTVAPGGNDTILTMNLDRPPSSVKVVTDLGNVFEAAPTHLNPSKGQSVEGTPLKTWPGRTLANTPTSQGRMLAVSNEIVAWSDGELLAIYDWRGRCLSSLKGVNIKNLAAYSNVVVFVDGDELKAVREDGLLLWKLGGFSSRVRPYLAVEETGTVYVKTYDGSNSYIFAIDVDTGKVLLRISYPERWPYLRSDGKLTIVSLPGGCVKMYSKGRELVSLPQGFGAAWVDADRGLVALCPSGASNSLTIYLYDLSFNYLGSLTITPPVKADSLILEDLEFTKGGFAIYYIAYFSADYYCYVACTDLQGRVMFNDLVAFYDVAPSLEQRGCFKEYFIKVNSLALFVHGRPRLFNSSLVMELPPSNAIAATKSGATALASGNELALTQLLSNPGGLSRVYMNVDRGWVLLRNKGPRQKVAVEVKSQLPTANVSLSLVSTPPGLKYEVTPSLGQAPFSSTITLSADGVREGRYVAEVVAKVGGEVVGTQPLLIDVRSSPTLLKGSSTMEVSPSYLFFSTVEGFEAREVSVGSATNLNISSRAGAAPAKGWGGVIHEVHVPEDPLGPLFIALRVEDQYRGPPKLWEKRVMIYSGGSWRIVWSKDLADDSSGLEEVQIDVSSYVNPGDVVFVAVALAHIGGEAATAGAWIRVSGIGLPGSAFYTSGYYLTLYVKDCIVIKGVAKGQVVEVYDDSGTLLGSAEVVKDGEAIVSLSKGALSPYRYCLIKIRPVDGVAWTSNPMLLYGGDVLAFTG